MKGIAHGRREERRERGVALSLFFVLACVLPALGDALLPPETGRCDLQGVIAATDPVGAPLRDAPGGRVIRTLRAFEGGESLVRIVGYRGPWLLVELADGTSGWIFGERVGLAEGVGAEAVPVAGVPLPLGGTESGGPSL